MDIFFIQQLTDELAERLDRSRVDKVYQPGPHTLIFHFWNGRERLRLAASFHPDRLGLFLTGRVPANPPAPHRFAQLLRSRLARLRAVRQVPDERGVEMEFTGSDRRSYRLMAEFMGRNANLVLVDDLGRVVDCLKRRDEDGWGRIVRPGENYRVPDRPGNRHALTEEMTVPAEALAGGTRFGPWLMRNIHPMSPAAAQVMGSLVESGRDPTDVLAEFRDQVRKRKLFPAVIQVGGRDRLTALPGSFLPEKNLGMAASPSALAEGFFGETPEGVAGNYRKRFLEEALGKLRRRLETRLRNLREDSGRQGRWREEGKWGDLLLAHLFSLRKGMKEAVVEDWFADPPMPVSIPLDPALTPQENAVRYQKRKARAERGRKHIEERTASTLEEIAWLDSVAYGLEESESPEDLMQIELELELRDVPFRRPRPVTGKRPLQAAPPVNRGRSPGGFVLAWGKNNRGNDHIYRHVLKPLDLWFHAQGIPGAHLVLKSEPGREVPEADLLFAAGIAAGYSRGKDDAWVEVMVALGRDVKKPKGAPPGLVTVDSYRSVRVSPLRPEPKQE